MKSAKDCTCKLLLLIKTVIFSVMHFQRREQYKWSDFRWVQTNGRKKQCEIISSSFIEITCPSQPFGFKFFSLCYSYGRIFSLRILRSFMKSNFPASLVHALPLLPSPSAGLTAEQPEICSSALPRVLLWVSGSFVCRPIYLYHDQFSCAR